MRDSKIEKPSLGLICEFRDDVALHTTQRLYVEDIAENTEERTLQE
jgi:hypothetical protein